MRLATKLSLSYAALLILLIMLVVVLAVIQVNRLAASTQKLPAPGSPYEAQLIAERLARDGLASPVPAEWLADTLNEGGWFQVVNQQGDEVQSVGGPTDRQTRYTPAELAALATRSDPGWVYRLEAVKGPDGPMGIVVLAVPEGKMAPIAVFLTRAFVDRFTLFFVRGLGMALGAAVLISVLAGVWYALWLSRPLVRLSRELQAVAAGDLTRRIPTRGRDEIARLGQAFNSLVARLAEAERERSRIEAARRDLVANLSHDLRTPLTAIQGFAEQLAGDGLDPAARLRVAGVIRQRVEDLDSLLGDLLELSRLQALPPVRMEPVDLAEAVRERLIAILPEMEQARVTLDAEIPDAPAPVEADPRLIGRALQNLVSNALRHGGARHLTVRLAREEGEVTITVADDGQGIPPADLPHLFERYYRGTSATAQGRGSGLGLAIVKQIAEHHGGRVTVQTAPGHGTAFRIHLPIVRLM